MSPFFAVFLVLLVSSSSYAAGRLHGQLSYRVGYRFGYRQGYFDGDRGAWNRRRRETQPAFTTVLTAPARHNVPVHACSAPPRGTTYTGAAFAEAVADSGSLSDELFGARNPASVLPS